MFALILKDLRSFTNTRKYLIIQFVILSVLVFLFFIATVEFYAQGMDSQRDGPLIDVGKRTYTLFIVCIYFTLFIVPRHAVDSIYMERIGTNKNSPYFGSNNNETLLVLTPLGNSKILGGKLTAVVIWMLWGILLTVPFFALSIYMGGLPIRQLLRCFAVLLVCCPFFTMIGMGLALWNPPIRAKSISYGIILAFTFLPMLPITPFADIQMLAVLSPLSALLSILQSDTTYLWMWNICVNFVLTLLLFLLSVRRLS